MRRSWPMAILILGSLGCPADTDEPADGDGSTGAAATESSGSATTADPTTSTQSGTGTTSGSSSSATATTPQTSTTATTEVPETATETATDSDTSSESGEPECPLGPRAEFSEVEGCGEVLGESFCSEGRNHVEQDSELTFESNPPHSGDHYPTWAAWGEHDPALPRGNWVHNLEHGGIALLYLCPEGCEEELDVYREVIAERPELRFIITSDPGLEEEGFAAVSWTWVHRFDSPDLDELLCFADQHENHAPEDVP